MMPKCVWCDQRVQPQTKICEIATGFFSPTEGHFFYQDESLGPLVYIHPECFSRALEGKAPPSG